MKQATSFDGDGPLAGAKGRFGRPWTVSAADEAEFQRAMDDYKIRSGRQFPTWSEVFEVLRGLGYAKRIWRPIDPASAGSPVPQAPPETFRPMGQDASTGLLGWFSRVEIASVGGQTSST